MTQSNVSRAIGSLLVLFFCIFVPAYPSAAPPPSSQEQLGPANLPAEWWDFIEDVESRGKMIEMLIQQSEAAVATLSDDKREQAQTLVGGVERNLQAYAKAVVQPLPTSTPPSPFTESYTFENLVHLNTLLQKDRIDLQAKTDERIITEQEIELLQSNLDVVRQKHLDAEERSEEKILLALEKISLRPGLELARIRLLTLNRTIENEKKDISYLNEEIAVAKARLVSTPQELKVLALQLEQTKRTWEVRKKALQAKKDTLAKDQADDSTEEGKTKNQTLTLALTEAALASLAAQNKHIETEILYSLAQLLNEPDNIDLNQLSQSFNAWSAILQEFRLNLEAWFSQSERILRRSAERISLAGQDQLKKGALQKNIELGQKVLLTIQGFGKEVDETSFLLSVLEEKSAVLEGRGAQWLRTVADFFLGIIALITGVFGKTLFHVRDHPVTILSLSQFTLILFGSWWISNLLTRTINQLVRTRKGIRKSAIYRLNRLLHYVILVVGVLFALTVIGFDFSNLIIVAGALGVGLGFGMQSIFNNFLSGVIILFQSHLKVGDYVELDDGTRGEIREINVRSTVITTNDGLEVLVPNSEMLSKRIINWTLRDPYRRIHVPFSVAYGSDIDEVSRVVIESAQKVPCTLQKIGVPEPQVFLSKFGDNALEMNLVVWVNEKWTRRINKTRSQYLWAMESTLQKHGFVIPFPQRDVHFIDTAAKKQR